MKWFQSFFGGKPEEQPATIAHKTGQDAVLCLSLLEVQKSLFCIDNYTILFKTEDGETRAIVPSNRILDTSEKYRDFDTVSTDKGFFVMYKGVQYHYDAEYTTQKALGTLIICITDVYGPQFEVGEKREISIDYNKPM